MSKRAKDIKPDVKPIHGANIYVSVSASIEVRQFIDADGKNLFERWFNKLDPMAAAKVSVSVERLAQGNFSNVKALGEGVLEYKLNWGPGYRIYFGKDGETLILLLAGGTKKRQSNDIAVAKRQWLHYQERKKSDGE